MWVETCQIHFSCLYLSTNWTDITFGFGKLTKVCLHTRRLTNDRQNYNRNYLNSQGEGQMPLEVASIQCKSLPNKKDVELFAEVTDESILVSNSLLQPCCASCMYGNPYAWRWKVHYGQSASSITEHHLCSGLARCSSQSNPLRSQFHRPRESRSAPKWTMQYPDGALSELSLLPHPRDDIIQPLGIGPSGPQPLRALWVPTE